MAKDASPDRMEGAFDWRTLQIELPGRRRRGHMTAATSRALQHEEHHFVHSVSTTLGLQLHKTNLDDLDAIASWKDVVLEPQAQLERVNAAIASVHRHERFRRTVWLDGYWREKGPAYGIALDAPGVAVDG